MKRLNHKGQDIVEYVVIIGVVTVLIIALVNYFGGFLKDAITKTSCPIVGQEYVPGDKPGEGKCELVKDKSIFD